MFTKDLVSSNNIIWNKVSGNILLIIFFDSISNYKGEQWTDLKQGKINIGTKRYERNQSIPIIKSNPRNIPKIAETSYSNNGWRPYYGKSSFTKSDRSNEVR